VSTNDIFKKLHHGRLPNTVRGDGVFHGLAGKFFRGGASEGVSTNDIFEKLRHGRFPNPLPNTIRGDGVFHGLAGNSEAEPPKMP
jgi:hypothetical protein